MEVGLPNFSAIRIDAQTVVFGARLFVICILDHMDRID